MLDSQSKLDIIRQSMAGQLDVPAYEAINREEAQTGEAVQAQHRDAGKRVWPVHRQIRRAAVVGGGFLGREGWLCRKLNPQHARIR